MLWQKWYKKKQLKHPNLNEKKVGNSMNHLIKIVAIITLALVPLEMQPRGGAQVPAQQPIPAPAPQSAPSPQPAPVAAPAPTPVRNVPIPAQKSGMPNIPTFSNLVVHVKNARGAWDGTTQKLNTAFVADIVQQSRLAQLDPLQIETLLQTARDVHGIFSGNQQKDIAILQSVDNQIAAAIQ
jgi:hypothetical protein